MENLPNEISLAIKATQDYKDVVNIHKSQPMLFHLSQFMNITAPYLYKMNCAIYETKTTSGLITSDNPCGYSNLNTRPNEEIDIVDAINSFTASNCDNLIVVNSKICKEKWFELE